MSIDKNEDLYISQQNESDEDDDVILIRSSNIAEFLEKLTAVIEAGYIHHDNDEE
jgi:hypothetical protein